ncbi:MAG TPA: TIR domain-containing protein [Thermoanaerobaculia bacterium]
MEQVLLADNNPNHLSTWAEVLKNAGYQVTTASSVSETHELLSSGGLDLAVLDLHMEGDNDAMDDSGLQLAKHYRDRVPIILLTAMPTVGTTIEALRKDGLSSPAVAVVRKLEDGPEQLLRAAREAITPKVLVSRGYSDMAQEVKDFLRKSGARIVESIEQSQSQETIFEIFEHHSNIQFAVVILAPDDEGGLKGEALRPRARQSAIFELGFLLAKLGRKRVIVLCRQGAVIEMPSNYQGVLYRDIDPEGGWQLELARDMTSAGVKLAHL